MDIGQILESRNQSTYARVLITAKQYGTDKNDGDSRYGISLQPILKILHKKKHFNSFLFVFLIAFFHVFKTADYRVDQVTGSDAKEFTMPVFLFKWSPPRAADYEITIRYVISMS